MPIRDSRFFSYLPVREEQLAWGIYVTGAGEGVIPPGSPYPPKDHPSLYSFDWREGRVLPEYQIIYISKGQGEFDSHESGMLDVREGSVIVLFPDVWHRYRPNPRTGWRETWMSLNGMILYELQQQGGLGPERPVLRVECGRSVESELHLLVDAIRTQPARNSLALSAIALRVLSAIVDNGAEGHADAPGAEGMTPLVRDALGLIWNWSYRPFSVSELGESLGVTARTLERHFLRELGASVREQITRCRLHRAQLLLRNTRLPIKHVAYAAGFSSAGRMSKVFGRVLHSSPSDWRRSQGADRRE